MREPPESGGLVGEQTAGREPGPAAGDDGWESFSGVLSEELERIRTGRSLRGLDAREARGRNALKRAHEAGLIGLALTGGGIDAVLFQVGALEGLARLGLLRRLDYLVCSSTGSLAGGWLAAWILRVGVRRVEWELGGESVHPDDGAGGALRPGGSGVGPGPGPVSYVGSTVGVFGARADLRVVPPKRDGGKSFWQSVQEAAYTGLARITAYVAQRLFSMESWVSGTAYVRNLLLNFSTLALMFAAVMVVPRLAVGLCDQATSVSPMVPFGLALFVGAVAIGFLALNQRELLAPTIGEGWPTFMRWGGVQLGVVLPLLVAAWLGGVLMWSVALHGGFSVRGWVGRASPVVAEGVLSSLERWLPGLDPQLLASALLGAVVYPGVWLVAVLAMLPVARWGTGRRVWAATSWRTLWAVLMVTPAVGMVGGLLVGALTRAGVPWAQAVGPGNVDASWSWRLVHLNVWIAPAILLLFVVTAFVHVGLSGAVVPESARLWMNHVLAGAMAYGTAWLGLASIALLGPMALVLVGPSITVQVFWTWLVITFVGVLVATQRGPSSEFQSSSFFERLVVSVAPPVFVAGLFLWIALGLHAVLSPGKEGLSESCQWFWAPDVGMEMGDILACHAERLLASSTGGALGGTGVLLLVLVAGAQLLSWRVNINEFSMARFLETRVGDVFEAASNERRSPQPLTGHDPIDRVPLTELVPPGSSAEGGYDGPYPVFVSSAHLRMDQPQDVLTRWRTSVPWIWSPLYTGLGLGEGLDRTMWPTPYRSTRTLGVELRRAMSVSATGLTGGGRTDPGPFMSFLLSVLGLRPVRWVGNPLKRTLWKEPRLGLLWVLSDLLRTIHLGSRFIPVADGAGFDATGVYELVRRRCRVVVVIEGGASSVEADGAMRLVSRRCASDLGIDIELDLGPVSPDEHGRTAQHVSVGRIRYTRVDDEGVDGTLVYVRRSHTGDEPLGAPGVGDGREGRLGREEFEALRILGDHVMVSTLAGTVEAARQRSGPEPFVEKLEACLRALGEEKSLWGRFSGREDGGE